MEEAWAHVTSRAYWAQVAVSTGSAFVALLVGALVFVLKWSTIAKRSVRICRFVDDLLTGVQPKPGKSVLKKRVTFDLDKNMTIDSGEADESDAVSPSSPESPCTMPSGVI